MTLLTCKTNHKLHSHLINYTKNLNLKQSGKMTTINIWDYKRIDMYFMDTDFFFHKAAKHMAILHCINPKTFYDR